MYRRTLLRGLSALPLLAAPASLLLAASRFTRSKLRRVRPADPAWPTAAQWQELNDAVGGNLIKVPPLYSACETEPGGAACQDVGANISNPFYIGDQPAGTEVSGWLKYDADGLFFVHHGVGSEDWSADGFTRIA
jgi:hypothetical protein